jgi:hypothetical protein
MNLRSVGRTQVVYSRYRLHIMFVATSIALAVLVVLYYPDKSLGTALFEIALAMLVLIAIGLLDRILLFSEVRRLLRDAMRSSTRLLQGATEVGIKKVYKTRESAADQILFEVKQAKHRVLLLAVAFSQGVHLSSLLKSLDRNPNWQRILERERIARKRNSASDPLDTPSDTHLDISAPDLDFRLLLLDPLRSPAVFRALLESQLSKAQAIVDTHRNSQPASDPYFQTRLYGDAVQAWAQIDQQEAIQDRVRFYGQAPVCWLVVIDDVAYYQPYSFGGRGDIDKAFCIGDLLPTFRIRAIGESGVFNVLVDHFDRLWQTSNTDWLGMCVRRADRHRILSKLLDVRAEWLRGVVGGRLARDRDGRERRRSPRQSAGSESDITLEIKLGTGEPINGYLRNVSMHGIGIGVATVPQPPPERGHRVRVRVASAVDGGARLVADTLFAKKLCTNDGYREFIIACPDDPKASNRRLGLSTQPLKRQGE